MMDKETGRHRGFGFVNYEMKDTVEQVLASGPHYMDGNMVNRKPLSLSTTRRSQVDVL
jgi:RNA-binding protein Musashi